LTLAHQGHLQLLGDLLGHAPEELVDVGDLSVDIRTLQRDLAQARAALAGRGVG
jgi:hypothetical protein